MSWSLCCNSLSCFVEYLVNRETFSLTNKRRLESVSSFTVVVFVTGSVGWLIGMCGLCIVTGVDLALILESCRTARGTTSSSKRFHSL